MARFASPSGVCPLVDGYKQFPQPADPVHAAYLGAIFLRELRGGVHIHAVEEVGLDPVAACYLQDPSIFSLHGYTDDEVPVVTDELETRKRRAEELTSQAMERCFAVLDADEIEALADGTNAMFAALTSPVAVAR